MFPPDVEDVGIVIEALLTSVSMVDGPIDDQHFPGIDSKGEFIWRHDIQHNDTQRNDIQHNNK